MDVTETLNTLIRRLSAANLTDVAREAGVSRRTLIRICNREHSPTLRTVADIVEAMDRMERGEAVGQGV